MTRCRGRTGQTPRLAQEFFDRGEPRTAAEDEDGPVDVLARGWIAAFRPLEPFKGELSGDLDTIIDVADDWTVETLVKLGVAAPDRAYEVAVRIVELSDDPWILANVGVSVLEDLLRRDETYFRARLSAA